MIMLSLWTRRYDVCALVPPSTPLKMIRSSGYGHSSIAFNESGLAFNDQFSKAPMAVAKNSVLFESLSYLSVDIVHHVQGMRTKD
jgi:hypothetical protein